jgi:hypothetical protein
MAGDNFDGLDQIPNFDALIDKMGDRLFEVKSLGRVGSLIVGGVQEALSVVVGVVLSVAGQIGAFLAGAIAKGEDRAAPAFQVLAATAIADMFGVEPSGSDLTRAGGRGAREATASAIGDMMLRAFAGNAEAGGSGAIEPSLEPAKRFLSAMAQLSLEGWLEGWIVEALTLGQIETFGDLDDTISHVLGLGRASASVHGPLVKHMIVDPLEWYVAKQHRPALLSESLAVRQYLRGQITRDELDEEMGRQGWAPKRIDAHINNGRRFLGLADVEELARGGGWTSEMVVQHLRDQGYDAETAWWQVEADKRTRLNAIWQRAVTAALTAHANREITTGDLRNILQAAIPDDTERELYASVAGTLRSINAQQLGLADVRKAVTLGILNFGDFRRWLSDRGYSEGDALTLELMLRADIDVKFELETARAQAAADRATAAAARKAAAEARARQVEEDRALHARGSLADLRRAYVRGLIPIARVEELLGAEYDAETVALLVELAEEDRQAYAEQQQRAAEVKKGAARRRIDVGALDAAVIAGNMTIDQYRGALLDRNFDAGDAEILAATLADKLADRQAAEQKRREAALAAANRSIDLTRFEQLVRRGARSLSEYDALLQQLGYDDAARAALRELLQLKINDDAAAAAKRAGDGAAPGARELTLEQLRRAVILGLATEETYQSFVAAHGYDVDAQLILIGELRDDIEQAAAARARREAAAARSGQRDLAISVAARAARLGVIDPSAYEERLRAAGYDADDIAIELGLLTIEIADAQHARARQAATDARPGGTGLSLAQVARAVKAGQATLDEYRARAIGVGLDAGDVDVLTRLLADELATTAAAKARREELAGAVNTPTFSLGVLEELVRDGVLELPAYVARLQSAGLAAADAELLAELLAADTTG